MDVEAIKEVLNPVIIFLTSGVGATLLGVVIKAIVSAVAATKSKKYSKLTEGEREDIADKAAAKVLDAVSGGVNIEADALLDKYTQGRIDALETKYNELIGAANKTTEYMRAVLSAVRDFRTITLESKAKIQALLADEPLTVEKVKVTPVPTVTVTTTETEKKSKVSY